MKRVYAVLCVYVAGMALFWPRLLVVVDEERYVSQAIAFSQHRTSIVGAGILFPQPRVRAMSDYPPGTALLQAPFVSVFGWRGAFLVSLLALLAATMTTALWLREAGRDPAFALLLPAFVGVAAYGRVAMSDMPATAVVAVACWMMWRAKQRWRDSFLAGAAVGAILLFREPPILLVMPVLVGALLRRFVNPIAATSGLAIAIATRLALADALFGSPWYVRDPGYGFSLSSLSHTLLTYGFVLMVLLPGAALLPVFYRGERKRELAIGLALYISLFLSFEYDSVRASGFTKGIVDASRYMAPLIPIMAWMAADVWPRWLEAARQEWPATRVLPLVGAVVAAAIAFAVHPAARLQERVPLAILRGVNKHTVAGIPVITNTDATLKYLSAAYGARQVIPRYGLSVDSVASFARRFGRLNIAFLDRSDGNLFRVDAAGNAPFLAEVSRRCDVHPTFDETVSPWARVRVYELTSCR